MRTCYLAISFISMIFYSILPANAQSALEKFKVAVAADKNDLKLPPTNAFEFLQNIKYAIDTELFLDDSFFEPENLLLFTNAKSVKALGENQNWLMIKQANIEGVARSIQVNRQNTDEEKMGRLLINFNFSLITADYVIKILGPISKAVDPYKNFDLGHPMPLLAKTHRHGNMEICQSFKNRNTDTEVCSLVSGNGQVSKFNVVQTRKK